MMTSAANAMFNTVSDVKKEAEEQCKHPQFVCLQKRRQKFDLFCDEYCVIFLE